MRDQLIGLSYALLLTGIILTPLEFLILDATKFGTVAPYLFGSLIAGAGGLYWFKFRGQETTITVNDTQDPEPQDVGESSEA